MAHGIETIVVPASPRPRVPASSSATVHAFLINWPGQTENRLEIERALLPCVDRLDVLNKDPMIVAQPSGLPVVQASRLPGEPTASDGEPTASAVRIPTWHHLDPNESEHAEFNRGLALQDGDWHLAIAADCKSPCWPDLVRRIKALPPSIGVYGPNFDHTPWTYDLRRLRLVRPPSLVRRARTGRHGDCGTA